METPFSVGDVLRLKPGGRLANWRPDSNCEARSRVAVVTKVRAKKDLYQNVHGARMYVPVLGIYIKPEHRVKNVWVHPNEFKLFDHFDPQRANIYADYLEENGELEAASKLRRAFPLGELP